MTRLEIDADIRKAWTPPASFYTDPESFRAVRERVFAPSWQWVTDRDAARVPGQVWPFLHLPGLLDEPLVLSRDETDRLHALSNVCTHRGALVVEGAGIEKSLRCRYHGRRFGLDGRFQYMPEFDQAENFPAPCDDLPRAAVDTWGPHLFVSLRPERPLADLVRPMRDRLAWLPLDEFRFDASRSRDYLVRAHWALYCDNYLEGFHIPYVHSGLNQLLDYGQYSVELYDGSSLQLAVGKPGDELFDLPPGSPDHGRDIAAYYWWLFPNMMFNFYPWGLSINVVKPQGPELTRVSFLAYVWREERLDRGAGSGLDRVEREDEAVVEAVQQGLKSRLYDRGRYSPARETGTHHFHRLLAAALAGD